MSPREIVALYFDAWIARCGDMSEAPLAPDSRFPRPGRGFDDADSYRAMAREAGAMATSFTVRQQFTDGNTVCSIIDRQTALPAYQQDLGGGARPLLVAITQDLPAATRAIRDLGGIEAFLATLPAASPDLAGQARRLLLLL